MNALVAVAWLAMQAAEEPARPDPLEVARGLVDELRCPEALAALAPLVEPEVDPQVRRPALFLAGYCLAVANQRAEAKESFKEAWTIDLDAPAGIEVEPRIQELLDNVRNELLAAREDDRRAAREAKRAAVILETAGPPQISGGRRIPISATLTDPQRLVTRMRLEFRPDGEPDPFTLPMQRGDDGVWHGEIPGLYTLTPSGAYTVLWRVLALDDEGPLAESGTMEKPRETYVTVDDSLVPELRANERLPHGQRIAYALFGVTTAVVFTGLASATTTSVLASLDELSWARGPMQALTIVAPPFTTTLVAYAACDPLIDGNWKFLPPAIVLASGIPGAIAAAFADPAADDLGYVQAVGLIGGLGGGLGTAIAGVVAATIVTFDPPGGVHGE